MDDCRLVNLLNFMLHGCSSLTFEQETLLCSFASGRRLHVQWISGKIFPSSKSTVL